MPDPATQATDTPRAFYVYEVYENETAFNEHKKGRPFGKWKSRAMQVQVLAESGGFRKLVEAEPIALMPASRPDVVPAKKK